MAEPSPERTIASTVISGVLAAIVCGALGAAAWVQVTAGLLVASLAAVVLVSLFLRRIRHFLRTYQPRFPHSDNDQ